MFVNPEIVKRTLTLKAMLCSVVLLCCLLPMCACTAECPTGVNRDPVLCALCSDSQAAVRWNASSSWVLQPNIKYSCVNTNGSEITVTHSCYGGNELGIKTHVPILGTGDISRIHVIDTNFSAGVVCTFSGTYLANDYQIYNLPSASCTIRNSTECERDPDSCLLPATCVNNDGECQCQCTPEYEGDNCADTGRCKNGLSCKDKSPCSVNATLVPSSVTAYTKTTQHFVFTTPQHFVFTTPNTAVSTRLAESHTQTNLQQTSVTILSPTSTLLPESAGTAAAVTMTVLAVAGTLLTVIGIVTIALITICTKLRSAKVTYPTFSDKVDLGYEPVIIDAEYIIPESPCTVLHGLEPKIANAGKHSLYGSSLIFDFESMLSLEQDQPFETFLSQSNKEANDAEPEELGDPLTTPQYGTVRQQSEYIVSDLNEHIFTPNNDNELVVNTAMIFDDDSSMDESIASANEATEELGTAQMEIGDSPLPQEAVTSEYIQTDSLFRLFSDDSGVAMTTISYEDTDGENDEPVLNAAMIFDGDDDMDESLAGANETTEELGTALTEIGDSHSLLDKHRAVVSEYIQNDSGLGLFSDDSGVAMSMISYEDIDSENEVPDSKTSDQSSVQGFTPKAECQYMHSANLMQDNDSLLNGSTMSDTDFISDFGCELMGSTIAPRVSCPFLSNYIDNGNPIAPEDPS